MISLIEDLTMRDYINEIVKSFQEISKKEFIVNSDQDSKLFEYSKIY